MLDEKSKPITGANIFIEGTYTGTTSNTDGKYELNVSKTGSYTIVFKYLGYKSLKKKVAISEFPFTLDASLEENEISLDDFPSPENLWSKYLNEIEVDSPEKIAVIEKDYYVDISGMSPRYYQQNAINRTIEAIAKGQQRIILVMATGTGKTYTAFNIIWRLWKSGVSKRILFL